MQWDAQRNHYPDATNATERSINAPELWAHGCPRHFRQASARAILAAVMLASGGSFFTVVPQANAAEAAKAETGPVVSILQPQYNDQLRGIQSVVIGVQTQRYPAQSIEMFVDDRSATGGPIRFEAAPSANFNWDTTLFPDGPHLLRVQVIDTQGFRGAAEVTVYINNNKERDVSAPALQWLNVKNGDVLRGIVNVDLKIVDNFGAKLLFVNLKPADSKTKLPPRQWLMNRPPYTVRLDTTKVPDGLYTLDALAFDAMDNEGAAPQLRIGISNYAINPTWAVPDLRSAAATNSTRSTAPTTSPLPAAAPPKTVPSGGELEGSGSAAAATAATHSSEAGATTTRSTETATTRSTEAATASTKSVPNTASTVPAAPTAARTAPGQPARRVPASPVPAPQAPAVGAPAQENSSGSRHAALPPRERPQPAPNAALSVAPVPAAPSVVAPSVDVAPAPEMTSELADKNDSPRVTLPPVGPQKAVPTVNPQRPARVAAAPVVTNDRALLAVVIPESRDGSLSASQTAVERHERSLDETAGRLTHPAAAPRTAKAATPAPKASKASAKAPAATSQSQKTMVAAAPRTPRIAGEPQLGMAPTESGPTRIAESVKPQTTTEATRFARLTMPEQEKREMAVKSGASAASATTQLSPVLSTERPQGSVAAGIVGRTAPQAPSTKEQRLSAPRVAALPDLPNVTTGNPIRAAITVAPAVGESTLPAIHVVQRDETLSKIAAHYKMPANILAVHNNISATGKLVPGTKLRVPQPLQITYQGKAVTGDVASLMIGSTGVTPFRFLFERQGGYIKWDEKKQQVTARNATHEITLNIGQRAAIVNRKEVMMDLAAFLMSGRTMVPVRFFERALHAQVEWEPATGRFYVAMAN